MRALFGAGARPLGYDGGPDRDDPEYAFLAVDMDGARRSVVLLRGRILLAFDVAEGDARWDGPAGAVKLFERRGFGETLLLHALAPEPPALEDNLSLVGARVGDRVVMFHPERYSARSPVWFDADGAPKMKCLVTGLAPGSWEIWRELYLEEPEGFVKPGAGALYLEGRPGRYYLKKLY